MARALLAAEDEPASPTEDPSPGPAVALADPVAASSVVAPSPTTSTIADALLATGGPTTTSQASPPVTEPVSEPELLRQDAVPPTPSIPQRTPEFVTETPAPVVERDVAPPVAPEPDPVLPDAIASEPDPVIVDTAPTTHDRLPEQPDDTDRTAPPAERWWAKGGIANPPMLDTLLESDVDHIDANDNELLNDAVMVEEDASTTGYRSSDLRTILEWLAVIVSALVVALIIKAFVLQAFWIPSESMETTVNRGDRILVNKLSYRLHDVRRGDLVVFEKLPGTPGDTKDLIKRAIALPGETLEVRADGRIWIWGPGETPDDALLLDEPYLDPQNSLFAVPSSSDALSTDIWDENCVNQPRNPGRCTLGDDQYFMMGDNRNQSSDSRFFGPVPDENIIGRAFFRIWPLGDISTL